MNREMEKSLRIGLILCRVRKDCGNSFDQYDFWQILRSVLHTEETNSVVDKYNET